VDVPNQGFAPGDYIISVDLPTAGLILSSGVHHIFASTISIKTQVSFSSHLWGFFLQQSFWRSLVEQERKVYYYG
jgi:hypothetical protein